MALSSGQHVAACVPYSKRKLEWIVAKIERWEEATNCYIVKDLFPDKRKKVHSWEVSPENAIRFPCRKSDVFSPGNRVLSLWKEAGEWSSMFYEATVVDSYQPPNSEGIIKICYEGDSEVYEVPRTKAIKFESKSTRAAQSRGGKAAKVRKSPSDPSKEPPKKVKKSSRDSLETEILLQETDDVYDNSEYYLRYGGGYSVLEKKMRNYRALLIERYHDAHQSTLLNL